MHRRPFEGRHLVLYPLHYRSRSVDESESACGPEFVCDSKHSSSKSPVKSAILSTEGSDSSRKNAVNSKETSGASSDSKCRSLDSSCDKSNQESINNTNERKSRMKKRKDEKKKREVRSKSKSSKDRSKSGDSCRMPGTDEKGPDAAPCSPLKGFPFCTTEDNLLRGSNVSNCHHCVKLIN